MLPGVNYAINYCSFWNREQLQEYNTGGKTLLQLLLKIV